jgi:hypothetical protein
VVTPAGSDSSAPSTWTDKRSAPLSAAGLASSWPARDPIHINESVKFVTQHGIKQHEAAAMESDIRSSVIAGQESSFPP